MLRKLVLMILLAVFLVAASGCCLTDPRRRYGNLHNF